jgi:hypothetical protein
MPEYETDIWLNNYICTTVPNEEPTLYKTGKMSQHEKDN